MSARNNLKPICILLALTMPAAFANPSNPVVISGQASFSTTGNALSVINTPGTIINWQAFSIGANDVTRFVQQSAASAVLNRVVSNNPSSILGSLQSNGRVFLINPNGIVFGAGATVDVAGLVASTLNLSNADFLAGNSHFTQVPGAANIGNAGAITAHGDGLSGGQIFLVAPNVANTGVITAASGEILLAAGHSVDLVSTSNPALRVNITAPAGDATNVGSLIASSGSLGLFGAVLRNSGLVSADSATLQGGKIVFKASGRVDAGGTISATGGGSIAVLADMKTGTVNVSGKLDASAPNGGNGGFIDTSAAQVQITDTASVSTFSRDGKSGTWLIDPLDFIIAPTGGNITGATVSTSLASGNVVIANAAGTGNGDIFVGDVLNWNSAFNLTLNATRNVAVSQPITNTGTGSVNLRADASGVCVTGAASCGTVNFIGAGHVTAATTNIYYNPTGSNLAADLNGVGASYATPNNYTANVTGTLNAYMLVNDVNQLQAMNTNLSGNYALGTNINAAATSTWNAGAGFVPVGNSAAPFVGIFNGQSHTIDAFFINRTSVNNIGLFGFTGTGASPATISNVGLTNVNISGLNYVGALIGWQDYGTASNSYSTGVVSGRFLVGGLVGDNIGTINTSYSGVSVTGGAVAGLSQWIGGLAGANDCCRSGAGVVNNSYSTGAVNGGGASNVGGLLGGNFGTITNSYSTGAVSNGASIGGLTGHIGGGASVITSFWDMQTSVQAGSFGGVGLNTVQMKQQASFAGWDFVNIWAISPGAYPYLRMVAPQPALTPPALMAPPPAPVAPPPPAPVAPPPPAPVTPPAPPPPAPLAPPSQVVAPILAGMVVPAVVNLPVVQPASPIDLALAASPSGAGNPADPAVVQDAVVAGAPVADASPAAAPLPVCR